MKKLPALILVMVFLAMNFASAAFADCAEGLISNGMQQLESIDQHDQKDADQQNNCDCCATCSGHHHHSHMAFMNSKADLIMASSQSLHGSNENTFLSQLNYPPSKPPRT